MPSQSKQERILELFLNEPTKHWHFKAVVGTAKVSEPVASKWLDILRKEHIIRHFKPQGEMPFFQGNWEHPNYDFKKRMFALEKLYDSGLLGRLLSLKDAKVVVIFGSWFIGDWNSQSDIDVFIYGDPEDLKFGTLWGGLGFHKNSREVQVHSFKTLGEIRSIRSELMKNVVKGYFVKGSIHDIAEVST
jgi:hypothetical protein